MSPSPCHTISVKDSQGVILVHWIRENVVHVGHLPSPNRSVTVFAGSTERKRCLVQLIWVDVIGEIQDARVESLFLHGDTLISEVSHSMNANPTTSTQQNSHVVGYVQTNHKCIAHGEQIIGQWLDTLPFKGFRLQL